MRKKKLPPGAFKLDKYEQWIEDHDHEFVPVSPEKEKEIRESFAVFQEQLRQKKNAVLNLRINKEILETLKKKAAKKKMKYQTYISDILTFEAQRKDY